MRRWVERGGWILILASVIFVNFCIFASLHLEKNIIAPLDLFLITSYASETPVYTGDFASGGNLQSEDEIYEPDPMPEIDELPLELPFIISEEIMLPFDIPPEEYSLIDENEEEKEEQENLLEERERDNFSTSGNINETIIIYTATSGNIDGGVYVDNDSIVEIRNTLYAILFIALTSISSFIVYIILKQLWMAIFY